MTKARIITKDGTKITIEGTPQEVSAVVANLRGRDLSASTGKDRDASKHKIKSRAKAMPTSSIANLIDGGFFKKPKELSAIKLALEEQGHYFPATSLSPVVLRLVRKHELRRIKDKKRWLYVQQ